MGFPEGAVQDADPLLQLEELRDRLALRMLKAVGLVAVLLIPLVQGRHPEMRSFSVGLFLLGGLAVGFWLIRAGRGLLGRWFLLIAMTAGLVARAALLGGADSPHFTMIAVVPLVASALLSARAGWGFAAAALLSGIALAVAEGAGLLPVPVRVDSPAVSVALVAALLGVGALVGSGLASGIRSALMQRRDAERGRRLTEERYALAAAGANYGAWDWDLATDTLWMAPGVAEILGEPAEARTVDANWWLLRTHPEDRRATWDGLPSNLARDEGTFRVEYRVRHASGGWIWVQSRGRAVEREDGRVVRAVGSFTDIGDVRAMRESLEHRALYDGLTGLPNRALFVRRLSERIGEGGRPWALFFVDLDRFKTLNDTFGHAAGDRILAQVADRLVAALSPADVVARVGGDEFAVLLADVDGLVDSEARTERALEAIGRPLSVDGSEVELRPSAGLLVGDGGSCSAQDAMRDVDYAMYAAKDEADLRYAVFHPSMRRELRAALELDLRLRRALENRAFVPWFQPIVDLETRRTIGWESLVRWEREDGSILLPGAFLPRAEEIGLLPDIDRQLVQEACAVVADWSVVGAPQTLSVNLSPRQFSRPDTVDWLAGILRKTGMPASRLQVELTEQTLLNDRGGVRETMRDLRDLGVRVALDDFGTGYSSLSYLESLPLDVLKIDRRFVQAGRGGVPGPICAAIVSMASSLGLVVVAEGVETEAQRDALLDLGCTQGQGWLFGRPSGTRTSSSRAG